MLVKKSQLLAIYAALAVDTAASWPLAKLNQKTNAAGGIARYAEAGFTPPKDLADLYAEIVADQEAGNQVELEDDGPANPEPTAKPKAAAKKPAAKPAKEPAKPKEKKEKKAKLTWAEKIAKWKKTPATLGTKGAGVFSTVLAELKAAGKGKKPTPITKEHIVGVLKEKFPDRDVEKMATSVNNLVPSRFGYKWGIHVWSDKMEDGRKGYYVVGDGKTPQPDAPKTEKVAKPAKAAAAKPKAKPPAKKLVKAK